MKQIIIILATVILGVYIGTNLIFGNTNSLKSGAVDIKNKATSEINTLIGPGD